MRTCTIARKQANPSGNEAELDENVKAGEYHEFALLIRSSLLVFLKLGFGGDFGSRPTSATAELPPACKVVSITPSGTSQWVQTMRIVTRLADGTFKAFFIKVGNVVRLELAECSFLTTGADSVRRSRIRDDERRVRCRERPVLGHS